MVYNCRGIFFYIINFRFIYLAFCFVSWDLTLEEGSWFSELAEARPVVCGGVPHVVESEGKVSIERNSVSLSLCQKTLNSKKVIKNRFIQKIKHYGYVTRSVRVKMLNCDIVLSEFEPRSCYYIYFRTNTLGEKYKLP